MLLAAMLEVAGVEHEVWLARNVHGPKSLPGGHPMIEIKLKYGKAQEPVIEHLRRISRPGLRRYMRSTEIPKVRQGLGMMILSTSKGLLTDSQARAQGIGGEALCEVW